MSRYQDLVDSLTEKAEFMSARADLLNSNEYRRASMAYWDAKGLVEQYIGRPRRRNRELLNKEEQE
jgi:hypothetical protein